MKLLLSTRDYPPELAELADWTNAIAQRLARRCDDFALLRTGSGAASLAEAGTLLETIVLPAHARSLAGAAARKLGGPRASRFDVVLGADWLSAALGLAWRGRSRQQRVLAVVHGPELDARGRLDTWPFGAVYGRGCARTLARCDAVFATSAHAGAVLTRRGWPLSAELVGSGCDTERFKPAARGALAREHGLLERRVLLSVARLVPRRQLDRLLFAVGALGVRYPDLCCVFAGAGPELERLQRLAVRLRVAHRVRFLGAVDAARLPELYNLADVVVQLSGGPPSGGEASASVLLQALACGKPLVATASAATEDVLDEQTARIVPDDDSTALADALTTLLDQPLLARRLGEQGRARVIATASWDLAAERLLGRARAAIDAAPGRSFALPPRAGGRPPLRGSNGVVVG